MRKREILGIILTLLLLVLTNKHWLIFKPMPVSFQVKGNGDYTFAVQLNKKDNNEFQKVKQCTIKKHLSGGYQKCECQIDRVRFPKRFRIVVNTPKLSPIEIKDISLKNGKYKFPSVSHFALNNAQLGQDSLVPSSSTFSLTYKEKLPVRSGIKFEALPFIIIAILGYLLSYKLTSYLADFKTEKKYSRIDIVFLAVCTVIMFLPMIHISDAKKSDAENRNLAVWKPLINKKGQINYNFGRDYDNWFSDRFNFREQLIMLSSYFLTEQNYANVVVGKENWLFYKPNNSIRNFQNLDVFTPEELKNVALYLTSINEYCKSENKKFYLFIAPDKNKIYGEYYPDYIKKYLPDSDSRAMQLVNYLKKNTEINVIYPYDALQAGKTTGLLYWKNDTHWNSLGAYIGYQALIEAFRKDNLNVKPVVPEKFKTYKKEIGELTTMLPKYRQFQENAEYKDIIIDSDFSKQEKMIGNKSEIIHTEKVLNAPSLYMYRDSFSRALIPYLSNTFSVADYNWTSQVKKSDIKNSDVVVLEILERFLYSRLLDKKMKD